VSAADTSEATRALRQLAAQYRQQLEHELAEAREEARLSPEGAAPAPSLIQKIHRIAGSSLSFGYAELGLQLQHIEQALRDAEAAGTPAAEPLARLAALPLPEDTPELFGQAGPSAPPLQATPSADSAAPVTAPASNDSEAQSLGLEGIAQSRALLLDPNGWLSSEAESVIRAYGFHTTRAREAGDRNGYAIVIECAGAASQTAEELACRNLILVVAEDGYAERLAAVRRGARALLTMPLDLPSLERRLQSLRLEQEQRQHRVLLVDDDALLLERYRLALEAAGLDARSLSAPAQLFDLLNEFRPDVLGSRSQPARVLGTGARARGAIH
jgi:HPt (histidine-containing phosphotransfer) domain-containing protein